MRVCTNINNLNLYKDNVPVRKRQVSKEPRIYNCFGCKYKSNRQYNVLRHEKRIHGARKPRTCCGAQFFTKADYYSHCELMHPKKRLHTIMSRNKYKILSDWNAIDQLHHAPHSNPCNSSFKLRFSERIRAKNYSLIYNDFDDIPLIKFLTNRQLNSYLKSLSSSGVPSKLVNKSDEKLEEQTNRTVKITTLSEINIEKFENSENGFGEVSNSTISSFSLELPAKKLILHRFRMNIMHELELSLREQDNNNCNEPLNLKIKQTKEIASSVIQGPSKSYKQYSRPNKENVSMFAFNSQQLNVDLDKEITVPVATEVHREFLSSIDFDKYKIFQK